MLRDRCPVVISIALKWCNAKTKWINHVYENFIKLYSTKDERYEATRIVLGISNKYRKFTFHNTISWENLNDDETEYWNIVESWVDWFTRRHLEIEISIKDGLTNQEIIQKYKELSEIDNADKLLNYIRTT